MRVSEIIVLAVLILAANLWLASGVFPEGLIYEPGQVLQGQWWRLVTHPFVHVSGYHLLLDGAAFLLLYGQLAERRLAKRLGYLAGIQAAVLSAVTLSLPHVQAVGYCGLSGLAHGLMAVWCLERMRTDGTERLPALGLFVCLVGKSIYEVTAGQVIFASTHLGDVGVPVVAAHLGGVIGAVVMYTVLHLRKPLVRVTADSGNYQQPQLSIREI